MSRPLTPDHSNAKRRPPGEPRRHTAQRRDRRRPIIRAEPGQGGPGSVPDVDSWRESVRHAIVELSATPLEPVGRPDYTGWVYGLDLGGISVIDVASDPVHVARTSRLINHAPVDFHHLNIALSPSLAEQNGRRTRTRRGDAVFFDGTVPFAVTADVFTHYLVVNVPHTTLRRASLRVNEHTLGQLVPAENPSLRVLIALISELGGQAAHLPPDALQELGYTAEELLVSSMRLAQSGERGFADARLSRGTQLLRMQDFVRRHLAEPDLSPRTVAAAFGVSVRYVEVAFREGGVSPSRFIRETRLAVARRMLADPRQRHRSIAAVGRSVGIDNPSVFARVFRNQYEATPREYRQFGLVVPG